MFETAIKSGSDLSVVHGGGQQNGAILGNGCAVFLAKFMSKLVLNYNKACIDQDCDNREMNKYIYKEALVLTLMDLSLEDMREHGRLLLLKDKLVNMVDRDN